MSKDNWDDLDFDSEDVCPNCGQFTEGESVCPHCGAILTEEDDDLEGFHEEEDV